MAEGKQVESALLTEHFRYTPLTLLDEIINTVNELVYQAVSAVERGLLDALPAALGFGRTESESLAIEGRESNGNGNMAAMPDTPDQREAAAAAAAAVEIENGVHQLETLLQATVDRNFDKLEIYVLRNILSVPADLVAWVRLKHYENLDFSSLNKLSTSNGDGNQIEENLTTDSLLNMRRKVQESQKLNASLRAETRRNDALIAQLRGLLGISSACANDGPMNVVKEEGEINTNAYELPQQPILSKNSNAQDSVVVASKIPKHNFAFLTNTLAAQELGLSSLDPNVKKLGVSANAAASENSAPVTAATVSALSQIPDLRASLEKLKPDLETLRSLAKKKINQGSRNRKEGIDDDVEQNLSKEVERAIYLHTQAKFYLEKRGYDVENGGSEGNKLLGRQRIPPEEVQSLERIASTFERE